MGARVLGSLCLFFADIGLLFRGTQERVGQIQPGGRPALLGGSRQGMKGDSATSLPGKYASRKQVPLRHDDERHSASKPLCAEGTVGRPRHFMKTTHILDLAWSRASGNSKPFTCVLLTIRNWGNADVSVGSPYPAMEMLSEHVTTRGPLP